MPKEQAAPAHRDDDPTPVSAPTRFCVRCGYPLDGLPRAVCPECGRGFDPGDTRTYLAAGQRPRTPRAFQLTLFAAAVVSTARLPISSPLILMVWGIVAGVAAVLVAPLAYYWRRSAHWETWELLNFILPIVTWLWCDYFFDRPKSLGNLACDPALIAVALPIAAVIRICLGSSWHPIRLKLTTLVVLCVWALIVYVGTGFLPE